MFLPEIPMIILVKLLILIISSLPRFTGPLKSELTNLRIPSIHSSIYRKLRVWSPVPHTSIVPPSCASNTFLQRAAGDFSFPPFHVPSGPKILS
jgi:hypothetical protein